MVIISTEGKGTFLELCEKTGSSICICSCNGNLTAVQKAVTKVQQEETHVISHHFLIKHDSFFLPLAPRSKTVCSVGDAMQVLNPKLKC